MTYENQCHQLKKQQQQAADTKNTSGKNISATTISNSKPNNNKKITKNLELSTHLVRHVAKRTTPQKDVILEPTPQTHRLPEQRLAVQSHV